MAIFPPSTLIICSRNRPQLLQDTVSSILQGNDLPSELIIVDQSSRPNSKLDGFVTERACRIRYVWTPTIGTSCARNLGIAKALSDILVFIDDDMYVAPGWYGAIVRALIEGGPKCVVTGRVLAAPSAEKYSFVVAVHEWEDPHVYAGRINRDILASGHMAMYRSAAREIGGFDERLGPGTRFAGAEDNDYGFRLLEAGYQIRYVPDSVVYHRAWKKIREYVPLFWNYGRGQGAFYAKHLKRQDRYMLHRFGKDLARYLRLLPGRIWRRQKTVLLGSTAFIFGVLLGSVEWWMTQRRASS